MNARGRILTSEAVNRILNALAGDEPFDLGGGLSAVRMARADPPAFRIDKDGAWGHLVDVAPREELAAISAVLWEKGKEFLPDDPADDLTPDALRDKPDEDDLTPDELREKADPLAGTVESMTPDTLRTSPDDPADLTPDNLK